MSHVLKLFLSIIHDRIRPKCDDQLRASQFGFRSGIRTREAQFVRNVLVQKCQDMQQNVFLCFIDYEKAFDRVQHEVLMQLLKDRFRRQGFADYPQPVLEVKCDGACGWRADVGTRSLYKRG